MALRLASPPAIALAAAIAASVATSLARAESAAPGAEGSVAQLTAALSGLQAHVAAVQAHAGQDGTTDLMARLADDIDTVRAGSAQMPPGYSQAQWAARIAAITALDTKLAGEMIDGAVAPPASARGMDEFLMRSKVDGTLQPYALYVPKNIKSLIVLLHGRPQTEVEILSVPYFHDLAEATGAVVVAPWGRGIYDFASPAADDVYQLAEEVRSSFGISQQHVYLAGYSMGGFSVFKIAPLHAERWAAIMCVSGAILNSETALVRYRLRDTPIYVVTGSDDTNIPTVYGEETAAYLAGIGMQVSFYEEQGGTHYLPTLVPSITQAWNDMLAGRVRYASAPTVAGKLPSYAPPPMAKPPRAR